jgi:hypothetical protein
MRSYSKKMRPGREENRNPPALKTYMEGHQRRQGKNPKKLPKRANFEDQ